jgi:bifunctional DNase/RNase
MKRALLVLAAVGCSRDPAHAPPQLSPAPAAVVDPGEPTGLPPGYVEVLAARVVPLGDQDALLLVDEPDNLALPIYIGGTEGASIESRLLHQPPPRPLTHDLLDHVMERLHGTLVQVQVDSLRHDPGGAGVYIGSIFVRAEGTVFRLDARPSDAIALAIGNHVPIYVRRAVLEEAGDNWDDIKRQLQQLGSAV